MKTGDEIRIEQVVGAEKDTGWIIGHYPSDKQKAVAVCPAEALFIVGTKMGIEIDLEDCRRILKIGRRAAIEEQKSK